MQLSLRDCVREGVTKEDDWQGEQMEDGRWRGGIWSEEERGEEERWLEETQGSHKLNYEVNAAGFKMLPVVWEHLLIVCRGVKWPQDEDEPCVG